MYVNFEHKCPKQGLWFMNWSHQLTTVDLSLHLLVAGVIGNVVGPAAARPLSLSSSSSARLSASFLRQILIKLILTS